MTDQKELFDLETIRKGLCAEPKHVTDELQWITDEGQELFQQRNKTVDFYEREIQSFTAAIDSVAPSLPDQLTLVDLGAGLSSKSVNLLQGLVRSHPGVRICYVPIDVSACVQGWRAYLEKDYPEVNECVVHIIPLVMDMVESLVRVDELLKDTVYQDWYRFYSSFGPNTLFLSNKYWNTLLKEVTKRIQNAGQGHFAFSFVSWNEHTVSRITEGLYSKVNLPGIMRCVLKGLNKVGGGDLDPEDFNFASEFILDIPTEDGQGKWAGWAMYAEAMTEVHAVFSKLGDLEVDIRKGERIRLSDDIVKSHYKDVSHLTAVAKNNGVQVVGNWTETTGLLSTMVLASGEV